MTITATGEYVVLDESEGLQNFYETAVAGDSDDNDISDSRLPSDFTARLTFYSLLVDEAALSGYGGAMTDAASDDGANIVTVTADPGQEITDLSLAANLAGDPFTAYGVGAVSTDSSGHFTVDGDEIFFFSDPSNDNIVYGVAGDTASGTGADIVLAFFLEEVKNLDGDIIAAKMWSVLMDGYTLAHGDTGDSDDSLDFTNKLFVAASAQADFDFAGAPPGSNLFMWFGSLDRAIIVTGRDPANQSDGENISSGDTVNTSGQTNTSLGTNGQQVKAGEGMYFTYVSGSTSSPDDDFIVPNLSQTEADVEANITFDNLVNATGGAFSISQVNPGNSSTTVAIRITAYTTDDEPGTGFVDGLGDADDVAVSITGVTINGVAAAFTANGDGVIVDGVQSGDIVGFTTDGIHQRVLIENAQPTSGKGSNISFDLGGFSLIQVTTDTEEIGSKVVIEDDGPGSGGDQAVPIFDLDESPLPPDGDGLHTVTEGLAGSFGVVDFGQDGEVSVTYEFLPLTPGSGSGLYALSASGTGMGDQINLFLSADGQTITGSTALVAGNVNAGNTYFTITVDGDGMVTLTQTQNVWHGDTADPDDRVGLSAAAGTIVLQQTITEGDGDQLVTELDLSTGVFFIEDDGPFLELTELSPTIAVDESVGTGGSSQDEPGNAAPDDETHVNAPAGAIGYAETSAASLFSETADAGTDGEDSKVYALVLNAGATGLTDTASGQAVVLVDNSGVIEGRTAVGNDLVFTIEVNSSTGDVTTTLYRALDHGSDGNDHDSFVSMASGLVELEATLTDNDTDTDSDKIELGSLIEFEDDGPHIMVEDTSLDSSDNPATYSSGAEGDWTDDPGSDGLGSLSVTFDSYEIDANGPVATSVTNSTFAMDGDDFHYTGSVIDDFNGDGVDDTVEFDLAFNMDGTYDVTFTTPPDSTVTFSTDFGSLDAGGPDPVRTLTVAGTDIVFSAVFALTDPNDIKTFLNESEATIEAGAGYLSSAQMNVSTSGIGLGDNLLEGNSNAGIDAAETSGNKIDESFVVDPDVDVSSMTVIINDNTNGSYDPASEELYYRIYYTDGTVGANVKVEAGDLEVVDKGLISFTIGDPNGPNEIDAVQLTMGTGTIKVPTIEFTSSQEFDPESLDLDFTATLFDDDSDSFDDGFSVHVEPDPIV